MDEILGDLMSNIPINFTKAALENLPRPTEQKRKFYKDTRVKELSLAVQESGYKSFYVTKWINGKSERILLGKFPDLTVEQARKGAQALLGQIASGINPQNEKRKLRHDLTLGEFFDQYMERHSKVHKKSWKYDEREIPRFLKVWFHRKLSDITKPEVRLLIDKIIAKSGKYQANRILERLRAMYNKAIEWGWEGLNPTAGIKKHREKKRDRFIKPNEMPYFFRALNEDENETAKDFIWMLLLTGARKTNTMTMRWEDILWELKEWRIPDTKNDDPFVVVLTPRALEILKKRYLKSQSAWVFPQEENLEKHYSCHKRAFIRIKEKASIYLWFDDIKVSEWVRPIVAQLPTYYNCGTGFERITTLAESENIKLPPSLMDIRLHDIRRTLGSYQAINGVSLEIIGKSLGHKSIQATQVYARLILDPVRKSVESATETMFDFAESNTSV
jgi:integrase